MSSAASGLDTGKIGVSDGDTFSFVLDKATGLLSDAVDVIDFDLEVGSTERGEFAYYHQRYSRLLKDRVR